MVSSFSLIRTRTTLGRNRKKSYIKLKSWEKPNMKFITVWCAINSVFNMFFELLSYPWIIVLYLNCSYLRNSSKYCSLPNSRHLSLRNPKKYLRKTNKILIQKWKDRIEDEWVLWPTQKIAGDSHERHGYLAEENKIVINDLKS